MFDDCSPAVELDRGGALAERVPLDTHDQMAAAENARLVVGEDPPGAQRRCVDGDLVELAVEVSRATRVPTQDQLVSAGRDAVVRGQRVAIVGLPALADLDPVHVHRDQASRPVECRRQMVPLVERQRRRVGLAGAVVDVVVERAVGDLERNLGRGQRVDAQAVLAIRSLVDQVGELGGRRRQIDPRLHRQRRRRVQR